MHLHTSVVAGRSQPTASRVCPAPEPIFFRETEKERDASARLAMSGCTTRVAPRGIRERGTTSRRVVTLQGRYRARHAGHAANDTVVDCGLAEKLKLANDVTLELLRQAISNDGDGKVDVKLPYVAVKLTTAAVNLYKANDKKGQVAELPKDS
jgi:hypothetical protein